MESSISTTEISANGTSGSRGGSPKEAEPDARGDARGGRLVSWPPGARRPRGRTPAPTRSGVRCADQRPLEAGARVGRWDGAAVRLAPSDARIRLLRGG